MLTITVLEDAVTPVADSNYGNAFVRVTQEYDTKVPTFSSPTTAGAIIGVSVDKVIYTAIAADGGGTLTYTLGGGLNAMTFNIDAETGEVRYNVSPPVTVTTREVAIIATDRAGNSTTHTVNFSVEEVGTLLEYFNFPDFGGYPSFRLINKFDGPFGRTYYGVDLGIDGGAHSMRHDNSGDQNGLDTIFNPNPSDSEGYNTIATQDENGESGHNGIDDERSAIVEGYTVILPTITELNALETYDTANTVLPAYLNGTVPVADLHADNPAIHQYYDFPSAGAIEFQLPIKESQQFPVLFQVMPAPAPLTVDITTIPTQTYPRFTQLPVLTLPTASGGGGDGDLTYTLLPTLADGLTFNATAHTISGATTATGNIIDSILTYTVTDSLTPPPQTIAYTFTLKSVDVNVAGAGGGEVGYYSDSNLNGALEVNDVGGDTNNDMRLILPESHAAQTFTVMTYAASPAPEGVTFSGVAMDIALTAGSLAANTVRDRLPVHRRRDRADRGKTNALPLAYCYRRLGNNRQQYLHLRQFRLRHYRRILAVRGRLWCSEASQFRHRIRDRSHKSVSPVNHGGR